MLVVLNDPIYRCQCLINQINNYNCDIFHHYIDQQFSPIFPETFGPTTELTNADWCSTLAAGEVDVIALEILPQNKFVYIFIGFNTKF